MGEVGTLTGTEGLSAPQGAAVLSDGTIIVSDTDNHVIKQIRDGEASILAGASLDYEKAENGLPQGAWWNGNGEIAFFHDPAGLAVDSSDNVYVADAGNHAIRRIDASGNVTTVAGSPELGFADGSSEEARFHYPTDVAVTKNGVLYVADTLNHVIRRIGVTGKVTTIGSVPERAALWQDGVAVMAGGYVNGGFDEAEFNEPAGLAIDSKGNLYVSDSGNHAIRYIDFGKRQVTTVAGLSAEDADLEMVLYAEPGYADGAADQARFHTPRGLEWSDELGLIIADSGNNAIRLLKDGVVSTLAGSWNGVGGFADGLENEALFQAPADVIELGTGGLLIADAGNNSLREWESYRVPANFRKSSAVQLDWNGKLIEAEEAGLQIEKGTTMIPAEKLGDFLGEEVLADESGMVPLRSVAEANGQNIRWLADEKLIVARAANGSAASSASAEQAAERTLTIESLTGLATVTQGGYLKLDAYTGMQLAPEDRIETEVWSSAVLVAEDTGDVITVGEQSVVDVISLHKSDGARLTKLELITGTAFYDVTDLSHSKDKFEVKAGEIINSVRGTHFVTSINPITGIFNQSVFSGAVTVSSNKRPASGGEQNSGKVQMIYPAQQITMDSMNEMPDPLVESVDLNELVKQADAEVIKKILENKQQIDEENDAFLREIESEDSSDNEGDLDLDSSEELEKYKQNVENSLYNLLKDSVRTGLLTEEQVQEIIQNANPELDTARQYDLNREIPPLDPSAGVDPAVERKKKEIEERQQQLQDKRLAEEKKKQDELQTNNASVIQQIINAARELQLANQRALEEKQKQAVDKLLEQLTNQQREALQQRIEDKKNEIEDRAAQQEQRLAEEQARNNPPSSGSYTPPPPPQKTVEVVYSVDYNGEAKVGRKHFILYGFKTTGINEDTEVRVGITVKKEDGEPVEGLILDPESEETQVSVTGSTYTLAGAGEEFKLSQLESPDNGLISFILLYPTEDDYEISLELLKVVGEELEPLGKKSLSVAVSANEVTYSNGVFTLDSAAFELTEDQGLDFYHIMFKNEIDGNEQPVVGATINVTSSHMEGGPIQWETDDEGAVAFELPRADDYQLSLTISYPEGISYDGYFMIQVVKTHPITQDFLGSVEYWFRLETS